MRLPAIEVESAVATAIVDLLGNQQQLFELLSLEGSEAQAQLGRAEWLRRDLQLMSLQEQLLGIKPILQKVLVHMHELVLTLRVDAFQALIAGAETPGKMKNLSLFELSFPLAIQRRGQETRLILSNSQRIHARSDETLIRLVARGYRWRHEIVQGIRSSAVEIARREGVTDAYVCRLMRLSFLAPDLLEAIISGEKPITTRTEIFHCIPTVPTDWESQRAAFKTICM